MFIMVNFHILICHDSMKAISTPSQPPRDVRDAEDLLDALQAAVASKTKIDLRGSGRHLQRGRPVRLTKCSLAPMSALSPMSLMNWFDRQSRYALA